MDSLKAEVNTGSEEYTDTKYQKLWDHVVSDGKISRVLVGKLLHVNSGVLQVHQLASKIDLVVVGIKENLFDKVGAIVALFDFQVVVEKFNITSKDSAGYTYKQYIMIKSSDVVVLKAPLSMTQELGIINSDTSSLYYIKLISKSGLVFSPQVLRDKPQNIISGMYFIARVVISDMQFQKELGEKWHTFVRFSGENALIHSCIDDGHGCIIKIPPSVNDRFIMRKCHSLALLRPLERYFGTSECVYIPENASVASTIPEKYYQSELSVTQILDPTFHEDLVSVVGVIKDRAHMSPKYSSEITGNPVDLEVSNKCHIGFPGNKTIRILLEDQENPNKEVWLYITNSSNKCVPHYPLGMIPGILITASCVRRHMSKENNIYLQCTMFSCLTPVSLLDLKIPITQSYLRKLKHSYLENIPNHGAFLSFATVRRIMKVTIKAVCCFCDSEIVSGSCAYVGCNAQPSVKLTASAQVLIDDGTANALLYLNSIDQVKILLQLTRQQYTSLSQHVISGCHQLTYLAKKSNHELGNFHSFKDSKVFNALCASEQLLQPLTVSCRRFASQSHLNKYDGYVHLYCLSLSMLRPNNDIETLVQRAK